MENNFIKTSTIRAENEEFETKFGFKPAGTNNFLCTYFCNSTLFRTILGDGGLSLDEFFLSDLPRIFFNSYLEDKRQDRLYMLSIIMTDGAYVNYIILKTDSANKKETIKKEYEKFNELFDSLFNLYIKDDNKKGRPFRSDSPIFKRLVDAKKKFLDFKKLQKDILSTI